MTNPNQKTKTAREWARDSLIALERDGRYSNLEVGAALERSGLSEADRALYTRLVYGVTERRITLDWIIRAYSKLPPEELDPEVLTALRLGLYQLTWMDRIPEHAAVGESAGLVSGGRVGYVNAVLRSYLRAGKTVRLPDPGESIPYLSVKYSVPEKLVKLFGECVPGEELESLLAALNREPPVGLRINTLRLSAEEAASLVDGRLSAFAPDLVLTDGVSARVREGLGGGSWFVQDEASRLASAAVGALPGETVIDTCACPGGKTFSMALDMKNEGTLYAFDLHPNKLSLIRSGAEKLGLTVIETEARDARKPRESLQGKADRVLCDAPCSGLGVMAKKPDIRYKNLDEIAGLPGIQYDVLCGSSEYVRAGGVLVYSTCTLVKAENEGVTERFLREHPAFALTEARTFLPHRDGTDGFYLARMIRNKE